ncbi:MAG TPA: histidine phosphatase family protein [Mycobacteriales bacterium]|nr:histidine phosphatase family protein [Mycobacteriales bacterium]
MTREYRQYRFTPPPGATDLLVIRHGESAPYREGHSVPTWHGHGDPELAPEGQQQAVRLADRLAHDRIDAIYVTPLRRTSETIAPLADRLGLTPVVEPDLREVHLGEWEEDGKFRRFTSEGHELALRMFAEQRWDVIPGAESTEDFTARIRRGISRIAAAHPDQRVVVVVHGGVIGALLSTATGAEGFAFVGADNASISQLVVAGDRWILRRFNDTAHLESMPVPSVPDQAAGAP